MYRASHGHISLALVGDVMLTKRLPQKFNPSLQGVSDIMNSVDCAIGNLETTIHSGEGVPAAFPGGGYAMSSPSIIYDLKRLGFKIMGCANNHSMDYGESGLIATMKYLNKADIAHCGIGKNLSQASKPVYFDCENGRIAMISITSSFHDSYLAGPQNQDMEGRPGVNPLRHNALYELNAKDLKELKRIAEISGINSYHAQAIKEGYLPSSQTFKFGSFSFREGESGVLHTSPNEHDLKRTIDGIRDARNMADIIIVSVHGHQFKGHKNQSPEFLEIFCRKCIDNGADIVFCHGPHEIRGIENYKKGIILYGLGNFILQHDQADSLPEEYYLKHGTTRQDCYGVSDGYLRQSANNTRGLNAQPQAWESAIAVINIDSENNKSLSLYPIKLDRYGIPQLVTNNSIIDKMINYSNAIINDIH